MRMVEGESSTAGLASLFQPEVYHLIQSIKRYGQGLKFFSDESSMTELLEQFGELRRRLYQPADSQVNPINLEECLQPFISLLRSIDINGSILGALSGSLARFLREERYPEATTIRPFRCLVVAATRCKLDGDIAGDEVALQRLLDVLLLAMKCPLSVYLSDQDICQVIELCFGLCVMPRIGELFKRQAELICIEICAIIFSRIRESSFTKNANDSLLMAIGSLKISYPGVKADEPEPLPPALAALEAELQEVAAKEKESEAKKEALKLSSGSSPISRSGSPASFASMKKENNKRSTIASPIEELESASPYGMTVIMELVNYLLSLLDVGEKRSTDRMRSLCLVIFTDLIELHSGEVKKIESLWSLLSNKLAKCLIQLLTMELPGITTHLHQTINALFGRYRRLMIAQFELFVSSLITLLNTKPLPGKTLRVSREFYLEILLQFCLDPSFIADLYVFYECGPRFGYLLSDLVNALTMNAMSDSKQSSNAGQDNSFYYLTLETILAMLKVFNTLGTSANLETDDLNDPDKLLKERQMKGLLKESADLFNNDPKEAFDFLAKNKLLTSSPASPNEVAKYLYRTAGLDKRAVGELISKPSNIEILKEFLADFNFAGLEIDEALRLVLESFRLPGESQQISRIMEVFAQIYYRDANQKGIFRNEDAVYVLAYSIIMLNTDQHNKQVRHRMTPEEFIRNNRGINKGASFEESFLRRIYLAIKEKEIVLPEEQGADAVFGYIWNEQLKKYSFIGDGGAPSELSLDLYAHDVLGSIFWKPILSCFRAQILVPRSEASSRMAIRGLAELGRVADRFLDGGQLDELVGILAESMSFNEIYNNPAGNQLPRYISRSELFKALIKCYFDQFRLYGNKIRVGWKAFVAHLMYLVQSTIVTLATFEVEIQGDRKSPTSTTKSLALAESSIFSTLSSYLTSAGSTDVSGIDNETRNKAMEVLKTCRLEEILRDSRFLEETSLKTLVLAMTDQVRLSRPVQWENDTLIFLVDLIVHIAWNNRDRMNVFWTPLFEKFSEIAKDLSAPAILREHCILGLGRLSLRFADSPEMQKEVVQFFQLLCYVPPDAFQSLAEPALSIVLRIVELDPPILHGTAIWPHYFTVLALAGRSKSCGPYSFGLLTTIVREDEILFPLEFYAEYVDLLNGFVASASASTNSNSNNSSHLPSPTTISSGELLPLTSIELATRALQTFGTLEINVRGLARSGKIEETMFWSDFVIPVHCAIAQQCYHPIKELRNLALSLLQRTILSIDFATQGIESLFEEFRLVLIPLLEELQRPEMKKLDGNVEEIQVRATACLSKIFLANISILFTTTNQSHNREKAEGLWIDLISNILKFLNGQSYLLKESIPETIKNMLLVMSSSGILKAPSSSGETFTLWTRTWTLLDSIMPNIKAEIFELATLTTTTFNKNVDKQRKDDDKEKEKEKEKEKRDDVEEKRDDDDDDDDNKEKEEKDNDDGHDNDDDDDKEEKVIIQKEHIDSSSMPTSVKSSPTENHEMSLIQSHPNSVESKSPTTMSIRDNSTLDV